MEFASFRQFLNAFGEKKKISEKPMSKINNLSLEQSLFGVFFFRRRRFKIALSAQLPFIIYNLSFIIYNWTQGFMADGIRGDLIYY
jgi:hypothetical protein